MSYYNARLQIYEQEIPPFLLEASRIDLLERLKGVDMNCGMQYTSFPFFKDLKPYSRFEHSLGVALIVYNFTKDIKQTIAGLFHDIATPAFSHVIDFLNHDYTKQESTEEKTRELIEKSKEAIAFLNKYNLKVEEVADYHLYPIADNDTPRLSADRLEYTLGVMEYYGYCSLDRIQEMYADLCVSKNEDGQEEIMFQSLDKAVEFCMHSMKASYVFSCPTDRYGMEQLARVVRQAIENGALSEKDLYTNEEIVVHKLLNSSSKKEWLAFCNLSKIYVSKDKVDDKWIQIPTKKRYINPYVQNVGRVSAHSKEIKEMHEEFLALEFKEYLYAK
ncbi:MAG: HD domain-containing protein [Solobacterium sp.]|nr:HD domain-containing protein [Solobacterium sp.]